MCVCVCVVVGGGGGGGGLDEGDMGRIMQMQLGNSKLVQLKEVC